MEELVQQARLTEPRFRADRRDLALAGSRQLEQRVQPLELGAPSDESGELLAVGGPELRACRRPAHELGDLDRRVEPLDRPGAQRRDLYGALGEPKGAGRDDDGAGVRHLLHARGQVSGLAHRGVIHLQVAADRAHDDLAGVEPDANPDRDPLGLLDQLGVAPDGLLHPERRVTGAHRMVLVGEGRAEQRHDAVAHHLVHGALVAVDRLHHPLQDGVEQPAGFLGIAVAEELHRALEIGEEHGDLLALADHGGARGADLVGDVCRRIGLRLDRRGRRGEPGAATVAEARAVGVVLVTTRTPHPFTLPAVRPSTM